jgi:formiminoglutamase
MKFLDAVDPELFFSRNDPEDPRLGDRVIRKTPQSGVESGSYDISVIGYPDDEGIKINGGRVGAALGPKEIRRWLYKMTPHPQRHLKSFYDLGDLSTEQELKDRLETAARIVESELKSKRKVLSLGGGNDYAYADGLGFLKTFAGGKEKPLVINVDAHLDVRNLERGLSSGTPFYRLLESGYEFDFVEYGIQAQCNSKVHWDYVVKKKGLIISLEELLDSGKSALDHFVWRMGDLLLRPRPTFVAIDIDAFAWPYAMGSSAAWPLGILPQDFYSVLQLLLHRMQVASLGIYEVSPPLDQQFGTAKLAALWAHMFLHED